MEETIWHPIETAPTDGTVVYAGKIGRMSSVPLYPLMSRYIDGKWQSCFGDDKWTPYEPQPTVWKPANPSPPT